MSLWSCTTCFKPFSRKGDLTRHRSLHTGIRPHVCETCGKRFAQFSGLKTHRNVHSKAKPYICGIGTCMKAFGDPSSRTRHRKETHRREGAYECVVTGCGTRIKRRSTFVAHLRKHGIDPNSLDLDSTVLRSREGGILTATPFAFPAVENKSRKAESRSVSPTFLDDTCGYYALSNSGDAIHSMNSNGWLDDDRIGLPRTDWSPTSNALLLDPISLGQTVNSDPPGLSHDIRPCSASDFKNPLCFDGMFSVTVDHPLLVASPLSLSVLEPYLQAGRDGSQSSSSSPLSAHSALYNTDFDDDAGSPSLANNASQESLLYNVM